MGDYLHAPVRLRYLVRLPVEVSDADRCSVTCNPAQMIQALAELSEHMILS